ncbi:MAG: methionine synthase, partial [Pseudomonadota bacterium]|nr:methionine synthase [Pseudomonadota bacterium]
MKRSEERILTTHVGSLARSEELLTILSDKELDKEIDESRFEELALKETIEIVRRQESSGIDVGGNGEIPRLGFSIYAKNRMRGFAGHSHRGTVTDFFKFPEYAAFMAKR